LSLCGKQHFTGRKRSFYMGLTSAEGQKIDYFKCAANNIFIGTIKIY
jgi:hypothetical protein